MYIYVLVISITSQFNATECKQTSFPMLTENAKPNTSKIPLAAFICFLNSNPVVAESKVSLQECPLARFTAIVINARFNNA